MRHRKSFNHLGRTSSSRKAMFSNMASSLILHKRITTTLAKAKALRSYVEPLITKSKEDTTHSRRVAFSYLQDKFAVTELFREVSAKVADRPGGYTRVIKLGTRAGDNAEMAMIELVDYNELLLTDKEAKKAKSTRRRRGSKKSTTDQATATAPGVKEEKVEAKIEEAPKEEAKAEAKKEEKAEEKPVEAKKEVEEVKEEKVEEKTASAEPKKEEPKKEEKKEDTEEKKA
jgi:large subunit ribosomal protein L17